MAVDDDPASAASDALSLHTIADQADAYATQELEDADFALALQLDEEESRASLGAQNRTSDGNVRDTRATAANLPPYRDDPADDEEGLGDLLPYRDDPEAAGSDAEGDVQPHDTAPAKRWWRTLPAAVFKRRNVKGFSGKLGRIPWCGIITAIGVFTLLGGIVGALVYALREPYMSDREKALRNSGSSNYRFNLSRLYPALEAGASNTCREAWESRQEDLYCQEQILWTEWDDGDAERVKAAKLDPWAYSEWICSSHCRRSIGALSNVCYRRTDRFDVRSYGSNKAPTYFTKEELPEGPVDALQRLTDRYDRLCAQPPRRQKTEWGTCAAEVWMTWGVVDGKNEMNMNGLQQFLDATSEAKLIQGGLRTGQVDLGGKSKKSYEVNEPDRRVGPGEGETDCGFCTLNWLERKMRSFEYGEMIDPEAGKPLGLAEFDERMTSAIRRCEKRDAQLVIDRVHEDWTQYGWWCRDKPCREDAELPDEVRALLHGLQYDDWPLTELRKMQSRSGAPKQALSALHDGLLSLPCSIWFTEGDAQLSIAPDHHRLHQLCSDQCRNAVDRVQEVHGAAIVGGAKEKPPYNILKVWPLAMNNTEKLCRSLSPKNIVRPDTQLCAPGYAALGHPEYIFAASEPPRTELLSIYSEKLEELAKKLPSHDPRDFTDPDVLRVLYRTLEESVCNGCAAELLVGHSSTFKQTIADWLDDDNIDGKEYTRVAKQWISTCGLKMRGIELTPQKLRILWRELGLDRYE